MKSQINKKIESLGGTKKNIFCADNKDQREAAFLNLENLFSSKLPDTYKDIHRSQGAPCFLNLIDVKCIDINPFASKQNKVAVGNFYCVTGDTESSINTILLTYKEQLPVGLLPICDGELGDIILMSLQQTDYQYIYYFAHEVPPGSNVFLVAKGFEEFIKKLEIHKEEDDDDNLVKKMNAEYTPQFLALLKKSGYHPK